MSDGTETTINEGYTRGIGEAGSTGGAAWMPPGGLGPYTVTYYEATSPSNPEDATAANIVPLTDGIQVSTTFTCEFIEEDATPPTLTVPAGMVVDAPTANGSTIVTAEDSVDGTAILEEDNTLTQDNDGGDITISCEPASGTEFPVGETEVQCIAIDAAGNSDTASFVVTVNPPLLDTTAPTITIPEYITVEATGSDGAEVPFQVAAEDDIDGPVDVACDYNSGDTFPIGETVVTCSAEDSAGNRAEESFTVTVQDTTAPDVEITEAIDRRNR